MKVLSDEEHDNYVHFCGLTGKEVEDQGIACKVICDRHLECLQDHAIKGKDDLIKNRDEWLRRYEATNAAAGPAPEGPEN